MKYIFTNYYRGTHWGVGNMLIDYFSAFIVGRILDLEHIHCETITTPMSNIHQDLKKVPEQQIKHPWDTILNLGSNKRSVDDVLRNDPQAKLVSIPSDQFFRRVDMAQARELASQAPEGSCFSLEKNNRIYLFELLEPEHQGQVAKGYYQRLLGEIRAHFQQNVRNNPQYSHHFAPRRRKVISVHVRCTGPADDMHYNRVPNLYYKNTLMSVLKAIGEDEPVQIHVFSDANSEGEQNTIKGYFSFCRHPIHYGFNENTVDTFLTMCASDIIVGGCSLFPRAAGILSKNLKLLRFTTLGQAREAWPDDEWLDASDGIDPEAIRQRLQ